MPNTDPLLARTIDEDRERGLDRRHAISRARRTAGEAPRSGRVRAIVEVVGRHLLSARGRSPIEDRVMATRTGEGPTAGTDRLLTELPCRTPDGRQGRVEVVLADGSWTLACRRT